MYFVLALLWSISAWASTPNGGRSCKEVLLLTNPINMSSALEELKVALDGIPFSAPLRERSWYQLLADYSRASEGDDNLLVVSLVGGGNAGKSTLFNSISSLIAADPQLYLNEPLSTVGHFPGLTRRMVIATSANPPDWVTAELRRRFAGGAGLEAWSRADASLTPGPGLVATRPEIPQGMAFVDSPDFDTGTIATTEPDNLSRALRVIYPSDALMLLVDSRTVRNQANVKRLSTSFRLYGRKKLVLIYLADPAIPPEEVRTHLVSLANSLYGVEGQEFPEGVLGAYIMPYSSDVAAGRALSQLEPLLGSLRFRDLVAQMSDEAHEIKRYSQNSAIANIVSGSEDFLRMHYKRAYTMRIYQKAVQVASQISGQQSVGDFHYLEVRELLRERFRSFDGRLRRLIYQFGTLTAIPDRILLDLLEHFRLNRALTQRLADDHKAHDRLAVIQMLSMLRNQRLPELKPLSADATSLQQACTEFFRMFPEEFQPPAEGQIILPSAHLLPEAVRREYERVLAGDPEVLIKQLAELIDHVQFDPSESLSRHDLNSMLGRIRQQEHWMRAGMVTLLDVSTLALPAYSSYWLANHGVSDFLIYLAVIIGTSRPLRWWSDHLVDNYLQREINRWYHSLQLDSTKRFFSETMSGNLNAAIARELEIYNGPEFHRLTRALKDVKTELNTSYSAP